VNGGVFHGAHGFTGNNVIVTINDQRRAAGGAQPRTVDDGIAKGRNDANPLEADALQMPRQPTGTLSEITDAFRLRADAGKTKELFLVRNTEQNCASSPARKTSLQSRQSHNSAQDSARRGDSEQTSKWLYLMKLHGC